MEENKKLDDFIKKSIKEVGLEKPSVNFTDLVVSKIEAESAKPHVFQYQPIFSKSTWLIILAMVTAIFVYVIFGNPDLETTWFSISQLNKMTTFNVLGKIPSYDVSSTFVYGILIFTFFVMVQVLVIKQRFDKYYSLN